MPRSTSKQPPSKQSQQARQAGDQKISLLSFVIHSINRLRGKPDTDYQNAQYQKQHTETRNPWKAVEIVSDYRACTVSKGLKGTRFLCDEAPTLPLPGCNAATCNCRYKHFSDRRTGPRRDDELGIHIHMADHQPRDRRANRGRRRSDHE